MAAGTVLGDSDQCVMAAGTVSGQCVMAAGTASGKSVSQSSSLRPEMLSRFCSPIHFK